MQGVNPTFLTVFCRLKQEDESENTNGRFCIYLLGV